MNTAVVNCVVFMEICNLKNWLLCIDVSNAKSKLYAVLNSLIHFSYFVLYSSTGIHIPYQSNITEEFVYSSQFV